MNVLHVSAQKPDSTGSGIYLTEIVRAVAARGDEGVRSHVSGVDSSSGAAGVAGAAGVVNAAGSPSAADLPDSSGSFDTSSSDAVSTPHTSHAQITQGVICGVAASDVIDLPADVRTYPVRFETDELPFHVVGMSNEMPYPATKYRDLTPQMTEQFMCAFERAIAAAFEDVSYTHVFCHHTYLASAVVIHWLKEHRPEVVVRVISHSTDMRQFKQIPLMRDYIRVAMQAADEVLALHKAQADELVKLYDLQPEQVRVVGSGYNKHVFYPEAPRAQKSVNEMRIPSEYVPVRPSRKRIVYAGKIGFKKGVMSLIKALGQVEDAFELVLCGGHSTPEEYEQIVAAARAFNEAEEERIARVNLDGGAPGDAAAAQSATSDSSVASGDAADAQSAPGDAAAAQSAPVYKSDHDILPSRITFRGKLTQKELADEFRASDVFVLPSFFEGLPLVAIEAAACGCEVVLTALPGLKEAFSSLAPGEEFFWHWVNPPQMRNTDEPVEEDLPRFEKDLAVAISVVLMLLPIDDEAFLRSIGMGLPERHVADLEHLSWEGVAARIFPEL